MSSKAKKTADKYDRVRGLETPGDKEKRLKRERHAKNYSVHASGKGKLDVPSPEKKESALTRAGWIFLLLGATAVIAVIVYEVLKML